MNNRIMAALIALTLCLCLFIGVVPVDAEAATTCKNNAHTLVVKRSNATLHEMGCSKCDYVAPAQAHAADKIDPCMCKVCKVVYKHDNKKFAHDETEHWKVCADCGVAIEGTLAEHTLKWTVKVEGGVSKHEGKCTCGYTVMEDHDYTGAEWKEDSAGKHYRYCTKCGDGNASYGDHDVERKDKGDGTHSAICKTCGKDFGFAAHDLDITVNNDGTHTIVCKKCDYKAENEAHVNEDAASGNCRCDKCNTPVHIFDTWNKNSDGLRHIKACSVCGAQDPNDKWAPHVFEYVSNGDGTHNKVCTTCGLKGENEPCPTSADHLCDYCKGYEAHPFDSSKKIAGGGATCTTEGWKAHNKCAVCGIYTLEDGRMVDRAGVMIAPLDHKYEETISWDEENHYYKCVRWNACKAVDESEAHELVYTYNNNGTHSFVCSGCGYKKDNIKCSDVEGDDKCSCVCGHVMYHRTSDAKMVRHSGVTPACETGGNYGYWECTTCGDMFIVDAAKPNETVYKTPGNPFLDALGHDWQHKEDISGKHVLECTRCSDKQLFEHVDEDGDCLCDVEYKNGRTCGVLMHSHEAVWVKGEAPTCAKEGFEGYWLYEACGKMFKNDFARTPITAPVAIAKVDHTPGQWANEGDEHVKYCDVCEIQLDTGDHEDANGDNRCDICSFELSLTYVEAVAATCDNPGKKAYYISDVTGRKYLDAEATQFVTDADLAIAKLNHVDPATGLGPVAADKGNGTHEFKCLLCSRVTKTEQHINTGCFCTACGAANGSHVATTYDAKAATCDKAGYVAYAKCSCGKYYDAMGNETTYKALEIKPLGHTWNEGLHNDDSSNKHYAVCDTCGAKNYGEHKLTTSDPLSGNYHQMICECGEVKLEKHYDKNGDNVCDDAGCKRDLSGKKVEVNNNPSTTVVTGDKETTNSTWSWLKNWLTNTTPSNGGGSSKAEETSKGNTSSSVPSQSGSSDNSSNVTPPAAGSNTGSDNGGSTSNPSNGGSNTTTEATGVLQYIVSFFTWLFSGFGA